MVTHAAGGCRKHMEVSEESKSAQERKSQLKYLPSPEAQMVKHLPAMWEARVWSLSWEDPLEKKRATYSSTVAWKILWTEEPGRLRSMGSQRVRHNLVTNTVSPEKGTIRSWEHGANNFSSPYLVHRPPPKPRRGQRQPARRENRHTGQRGKQMTTKWLAHHLWLSWSRPELGRGEAPIWLKVIYFYYYWLY